MSGPDRYQWRRDKDGLGVWEHRGKIAVTGAGLSPVDRRWDGVSMDQTLGAYTILACQKAMDEADVMADLPVLPHQPLEIFAPPYDSEWGITPVNAKWLIEQLGLTNVKFAPTGLPTISEMAGMAAQAVGGGYVEGDRRPRLSRRTRERASRGHPGPAAGARRQCVRPPGLYRVHLQPVTRLWPVGRTGRRVKRCRS